MWQVLWNHTYPNGARSSEQIDVFTSRSRAMEIATLQAGLPGNSRVRVQGPPNEEVTWIDANERDC